MSALDIKRAVGFDISKATTFAFDNGWHETVAAMFTSLFGIIYDSS